VDGFAVHAAIVVGKIIRYDIGAQHYHRVDREPVHPTLHFSTHFPVP